MPKFRKTEADLAHQAARNGSLLKREARRIRGHVDEYLTSNLATARRGLARKKQKIKTTVLEETVWVSGLRSMELATTLKGATARELTERVVETLCQNNHHCTTRIRWWGKCRTSHWNRSPGSLEEAQDWEKSMPERHPTRGGKLLEIKPEEVIESMNYAVMEKKFPDRWKVAKGWFY